MGTKPYIVGIAGGSGSGKSTLAMYLKETLPEFDVRVISTDGFFKHQLPKMTSPVNGKEYEDWNSPESLDYDSFEKAFKSCENSGCDVLLLEGLSVLYFDEIRKVLDLKVFIDLDSDERLYRRIKRNTETMNVNIDDVSDYFLRSAKLMEGRNYLPTKTYADIIVNGYCLNGIAADMISSWIRKAVNIGSKGML